jgi:hypothetical protein
LATGGMSTTACSDFVNGPADNLRQFNQMRRFVKEQI